MYFMTYYLLKSGKENIATPLRLVEDPSILKTFSSKLGWDVFRELSKPNCAIDIAKKLGVHEQKVYYYINKFNRKGLLKEIRREARHGAFAKFYQVRDHVLGIQIGEGPVEKVLNISSPKDSKILEPFIEKGQLNSRIIIGSPDPHGPWKARASDACCGVDLALFLGSFVDKVSPNYKLDTEIRESDLKANLILIGGPAVNMITNKLNQELPIYVDLTGEVKIISKLSKRTYSEDECGLICIIDNPFDSRFKLLILAGKRFQGTRAAVIAFINNLDKIMQGNKFNKSIKAHVVRGYDVDGDGVIDDVEFLE